MARYLYYLFRRLLVGWKKLTEQSKQSKDLEGFELK